MSEQLELCLISEMLRYCDLDQGSPDMQWPEEELETDRYARIAWSPSQSLTMNARRLKLVMKLAWTVSYSALLTEILARTAEQKAGEAQDCA